MAGNATRTVKRTVWVPQDQGGPVRRVELEVPRTWDYGAGKRDAVEKSVEAVRAAAVEAGLPEPVEVSLSGDRLGRSLSALNVSAPIGKNRVDCVERMFQSAKVRAAGEPCPAPGTKGAGLAAIKACRNSPGALAGSLRAGNAWGPGAEEQAAFKAWLYGKVMALPANAEKLERLKSCGAFTDAFETPKDPSDAMAAAVVAGLAKQGRLEEALQSPEAWRCALDMGAGEARVPSPSADELAAARDPDWNTSPDAARGLARALDASHLETDRSALPASPHVLLDGSYALPRSLFGYPDPGSEADGRAERAGAALASLLSEAVPGATYHVVPTQGAAMDVARALADAGERVVLHVPAPEMSSKWHEEGRYGKRRFQELLDLAEDVAYAADEVPAPEEGGWASAKESAMEAARAESDVAMTLGRPDDAAPEGGVVIDPFLKTVEPVVSNLPVEPVPLASVTPQEKIAGWSRDLETGTERLGQPARDAADELADPLGAAPGPWGPDGGSTQEPDAGRDDPLGTPAGADRSGLAERVRGAMEALRSWEEAAGKDDVAGMVESMRTALALMGQQTTAAEAAAVTLELMGDRGAPCREAAPAKRGPERAAGRPPAAPPGLAAASDPMGDLARAREASRAADAEARADAERRMAESQARMAEADAARRERDQAERAKAPAPAAFEADVDGDIGPMGNLGPDAGHKAAVPAGEAAVGPGLDPDELDWAFDPDEEPDGFETVEAADEAGPLRAAGAEARDEPARPKGPKAGTRTAHVPWADPEPEAGDDDMPDF